MEVFNYVRGRKKIQNMREGGRINNTLKVFVKVKERITLFYICLKSQIIYVSIFVYIRLYMHI